MSFSRILLGDSLELMRREPDYSFSAACFSPPYDVGSADGFDVRQDFGPNGAFLPYARELSRVSLVWGINLTQKVDNKVNLPYLEEFVVELGKEGISLFDRWVVVKPTVRPRRGQRALTNFEFVLLFSQVPGEVVKRAEGRTVIMVNGHHSRSAKGLGFTPYFPEIPRQLFGMYGIPGRPVLDPFCGSGTSLLEARALGLDYVGMEKDPNVYARCVGALGK